MQSATIEEKPQFFSFSAHDVRDHLFDSYPVLVHQISTDLKPGKSALRRD